MTSRENVLGGISCSNKMTCVSVSRSPISPNVLMNETPLYEYT